MSNVVAYVNRQRARYLLADLWRFATETKILDKLEELPHREMVAEIFAMVPDFDGGAKRRQKRKIYLTPRYTYKSSIVIAFIVYLILRYPNISIVIYRATQTKAMEMLEQIKTILSTNEEILRVFGDVSIDAPKWQAKQIIVNTRTKVSTDPTISVYGLKTAAAGGHPDIAFLDDIVTEVNCNSIQEMEKGTALIGSIYPLLPIWGSLLITGTRWTEIDAYGKVLDINRNLVDQGKDRDYDEYIKKAWWRDANGDIVLFFPRDLTLDFLERQKETIPNPQMFWSWYFQETHEQGLHAFPRERIQIIEFGVSVSPFHVLEFDEPVLLTDYDKAVRDIPVYVAAIMDPALTGGRSSDEYGITIQAWDALKNWFFLEAQGFRALPSVAGDKMIELLAKYRPRTFLIESGGDAEMVARMSRWIRDAQIDCTIRSYSALQDELPGQRGKDQRILAMEPIVRDKKFYVRRGFCGPLVRQLDAYPSLTHDDVIDSAAMGRKLAKFAPSMIRSFINEDDFEPADQFYEMLATQESDRIKGQALLRSGRRGR